MCGLLRKPRGKPSTRSIQKRVKWSVSAIAQRPMGGTEEDDQRIRLYSAPQGLGQPGRPGKVLEGTGLKMRHVKVRSADDSSQRFGHYSGPHWN